MNHEPPPLLFVSHAREDRELTNELRSFAAGCLEDIEWCDDGRLQPGVDWDESIASAVERSFAALVLVSQHCLSSDFVWGHEIARLRERGVPLSWLKIRECPWDLSGKAAILRSL